MIHKSRNLIHGKGLLQIIAVHVHITYDDTDLPVAVSFLPHQRPNCSCHGHGLLLRISCHMNSDRLRLFSESLPMIAEQVSFQKSQGIMILKTIRRPAIQADRLVNRYVMISGKPHQRGHHMLSKPKELVWVLIDVRIFPVIHGHRNHYFAAMGHKFQKQPVLHRRKAGKPIQHYRAVLEHIRLADHLA